jgi:PilZ domain
MMPEPIVPVATETSDRTELERRAWVRYPCRRDAVYCALPSYDRFGCQVRNLSVDGVALVLTTEAAPGTELIVEMKTTARRIYLTLLARVVHCTALSECEWLVGCEFITKPTEEQLKALL